MDLPPLSASRDPVVRERGTIFECAAKYLSLEVTQAYKYQPGKYATGNLFRQRWMNSSSCIPPDDLRELIESGQSSDRGCDSAYFVGDPTMTSKDARELALCLAPYYVVGQKDHKAMLDAIEPAPTESPGSLTCCICSDDFDAGDTVACSGDDIHFFCKPCLSSYCTLTLESGPIQSITCAMPDCKALYATNDVKSSLQSWQNQLDIDGALV